MPQVLSVQDEQRINYLSQLDTLENPYFNCELHPLGLQQQNQTFWTTALMGKLACFYCGHRIQGVPYPKPVGFDAEKFIFRVQGCYCTFNCVLSSILENEGHQQKAQQQWLSILMFEMYEIRQIVRPFSKVLFEMYGGPVRYEDFLKKVASGQPLPLVNVRTGAPFIPVDMLIETQTKTIDFLRLKIPNLAPPSTIQEPFYVNKNNHHATEKKNSGATATAMAMPIAMSEESSIIHGPPVGGATKTAATAHKPMKNLNPKKPKPKNKPDLDLTKVETKGEAKGQSKGQSKDQTKGQSEVKIQDKPQDKPQVKNQVKPQVKNATPKKPHSLEHFLSVLEKPKNKPKIKEEEPPSPDNVSVRTRSRSRSNSPKSNQK